MRGENGPPLQVAAVDFLDRGDRTVRGVSEVVAASWERSRAAGVDTVQPQSVFTADVDTDSLLVRCGRTVLEQFAADTADLPLTIGVADRRGLVVQRYDSAPTITRLFDRVQYAPGFDFSESTMGTNGAGTVLAAGQPVRLIGTDHFSEKLQRFAASGAPLIDPVTGRIEGALTVVLPVESWNPIVAALAKNAAKEVGRNLLLDRSQAQQAIFDAFVQATARSTRSAIFAFGHAVAIASPAAQRLFDPAEQQLLCEHAAFLLTHRDRMSDTVALPDSQHLARIRATRIFAGSKVVGTLVFAEPVQSLRAESSGDATAPPPARSAASGAGALLRPPETPAGGRSPAWLRARSELCEALQQRKPALLVGETGTGKVTLATELFHSVHPGARCVALDATRPDGPPPRDTDGPTLHIVRGIDQMSADGVGRVRAYLAAVDALEQPGWVVATAQHAPGLPFGELLAHFDTAITVPPLRCRTDDLPGITAAVLQTIAPHRTVRLSAEAQRLICRYSWPRNISQLRESLEHAVRCRPVGEIQDVDLPGYCRTAARRTLTVLEGLERDAIVAALRETDGNRVVAASRLGMSRSSLYRKLKTYGITG